MNALAIHHDQQGRIPSDIGGYFAYDSATGIITRTKLLRSGGNVSVGEPIRTISPAGYLKFHFRGKPYLAHRVAFFLMTGQQPDIVDHRDGNTLNNRWDNLREADPAQSSANRRPLRSALKKGVRSIPRSAKFEARICFRGKRLTLGYFETEEEAHAAYNEAARGLHGEFARLA